MKVCLLNGSPHLKGNTYNLLCQIAEELKKEGLDSQILDFGNGPVRDGVGCGACAKLGRCVFNDDNINAVAEEISKADGLIVGSPVYYAHPSGRILSALDRLFYSVKGAFAFKPAAAVSVARRAGTCASMDVLNKYFTVSQMPVVTSSYWNMEFGGKPGEVEQDKEGIQTIQRLARNMAWMLKCIEAGKQAGILPPEQDEAQKMNFIR